MVNRLLRKRVPYTPDQDTRKPTVNKAYEGPTHKDKDRCDTVQQKRERTTTIGPSESTPDPESQKRSHGAEKKEETPLWDASAMAKKISPVNSLSEDLPYPDPRQSQSKEEKYTEKVTKDIYENLFDPKANDHAKHNINTKVSSWIFETRDNDGNRFKACSQDTIKSPSRNGSETSDVGDQDHGIVFRDLATSEVGVEDDPGIADQDLTASQNSEPSSSGSEVGFEQDLGIAAQDLTASRNSEPSSSGSEVGFEQDPGIAAQDLTASRNSEPSSSGSEFGFEQDPGIAAHDLTASRNSEPSSSESEVGVEQDHGIAAQDLEPSPQNSQPERNGSDVDIEQDHNVASHGRATSSAPSQRDLSESSTTGDIDEQFLDTDVLVNLLRTSRACLDSIPSGLKENKYFIFDNERNTNKRNNNKQRDFSDDCGAWVSKKVLLPSSHILFWTMESWEESSLWKARGNAMKNSLTRNVTPYHLLLNLHLRNSLLFIVITPLWKKKLEEDHRYKKRVSSLAKGGVNGLRDISIVEYIGKFPGLSTHGNQKRTENKYVRTQAEVIGQYIWHA